MLKNYSLSIVLAMLFLASWAGQGYFQWQEFQSEQEQHGQEATIEDFNSAFWQSTLENWQSEFLQLLTFVMLTSFLIHKGSHESKDSDERMEQKIDKILKVVERK
jgi:hypothetical protein